MLRTTEARLEPRFHLASGNYCIVRSLSKGGMGAVYLAEDRRAFERLCVVKQMIEYYDPADPEERHRARQRFEEEGRTLASLCHPGIPKIYAFFSENGLFYIVMEYIQGANLECFVTHEDGTGALVPRRPLPQEEIVRYVIQAGRILEYLHSQARPVVHQDIKPSNLVLEQELGYLRLVDFGTARAEIPTGALPGNGAKASIYGTEGYAAPEQYRGKPVPRSDVFALAATAYHLLTDDDPSKHPFQFPRLRDLSRDLASALERALRTNPEQRSTAAEFRQSLEALSTPRRTLEAFTFPGGDQIRSVAALPTLCDEHWDAARSFLYDGDFARWLRDINRLDLVAAADEIVKQWPNHDAGLEAFLHRVDPGLAHPKLVADLQTIDLGSVARESALLRRVTVLNSGRGYVLAHVSSSQPWLEVFPTTLHLWSGRPVDIRVNVHAEGLPFRRQQLGALRVEADGQTPIEIAVSARVSLLREAWRLCRRSLGAALPESWRGFRAGWRRLGRFARSANRAVSDHPWLIWALWLAIGALAGVGLYHVPDWALGAEVLGWTVRRPGEWLEYVAPVILAPPAIVSSLWLTTVAVTLFGSALWGALRGAWRSLFR